MKRWRLGTLLLLALPACDGSGALASDGGGPEVPASDAGVSDFDDGGPASDAGVGGGADGGQAIDAGIPPGGEGEFDDGLDVATARAACFDGEDNDGDGTSDCGDPSCQRNVPSCCVGRSSVDCCVPGTIERLDPTGCAGVLSGCRSDGLVFTTFGAPAPTVTDFGDPTAAIVPGGMDTDSGAVLSRDLDPRAGTIRLTASIASPLESPPSGRVETVGVGFVDATASSSLTRVAPVTGLVVSRNRAEVLLMIAGEAVQRWPLEVSTAVTYTLEIDPTGRVRAASSPDFVAADVPYRVEAPVRAIAYGRTANPTPTTPPARLLGLTVTPSECDMPAALERFGAPRVPAPGGDGTWADGHVVIGEPAVVRYLDPSGTGQVRMALMVDDELHLAAPGAGGFELRSLVGEPALPPPAEAWAAAGVSDPSLTYRGDQLELYFTGWSSEGRGTIARAVWDEAMSRFVLDGPVPGLEATMTVGYSAASVFDREGVLHAALRVDDEHGHRIAIYRMTGGAEAVVGTVRTTSEDSFAFDRDEVDGPAVVHVGSVYRLYFGGRRGTRWNVGLLVSDDGLAWHAPSDAPVLTPSGAGFDALAVRDPSPDVVAGRVDVYYAGDDGSAVRIGLARAR
ncbi:MAG: hypothetical protein KC619_18890 [Myxococcales bacterium]|nr:hypothetical protein [Myxococcales bacterium]